MPVDPYGVDPEDALLDDDQLDVLSADRVAAVVGHQQLDRVVGDVDPQSTV